MGVYVPGSVGNPKQKEEEQFHIRPSVGLKMWGPLVPASDFRPGLFFLTGSQFTIGVLMWVLARRQYGIPKAIRPRFTTAKMWVNSLAGGYLIFQSGLELSRLILPYDPWFDEALVARVVALQKGQKISLWFGPLDFKPMSHQQWLDKLDNWVEKTEEQAEIFEAKRDSLGGMHDFKVLNDILLTQYDTLVKNRKENFVNLIKGLEGKRNTETSPDGLIKFKPLIKIDPKIHNPDDIDPETADRIYNPWEELKLSIFEQIRYIPMTGVYRDNILEQLELQSDEAHESNEAREMDI